MAELTLNEVVHAIRDLVPMLEPDDDYLTIQAAEGHMHETAQRREKELEDAHSALRSLAKILDAARASSTRPLSVPSEEAHAEAINELDASRLSFAKSINDAESALANKAAELARLKDETRALERSDPAAEHELDGTALRLQIYKGVGFETVTDKAGGVHKLLIRSTSGEVHCIDFLKGESVSMTPDTVWQLVCS